MIRSDPALQFRLLLARTLGYRTVAELDDTMTADEFSLWAAEYQLRPWGEYPADVRAAITGATVARTFGADVDPVDLIPRYDRDGDQSAKAQLFLAWAHAHNANQKPPTAA